METFSRETPSLDPWYVTGLLEGQGSFTYSRSGPTLGLYFSIKASPGDQELLARVREFFGGAGKIYRVKRKAAAAGAYFRVTKIDHLQRILDHFDDFPLRGQKRRAYRIWRAMVRLKSERFRRPDRARLEKLALELSAASPRRRSGKA